MAFPNNTSSFNQKTLDERWRDDDSYHLKSYKNLPIDHQVMIDAIIFIEELDAVFRVKPQGTRTQSTSVPARLICRREELAKDFQLERTLREDPLLLPGQDVTMYYDKIRQIISECPNGIYTPIPGEIKSANIASLLLILDNLPYPEHDSQIQRPSHRANVR